MSRRQVDANKAWHNGMKKVVFISGAFFGMAVFMSRFLPPPPPVDVYQAHKFIQNDEYSVADVEDYCNSNNKYSTHPKEGQMPGDGNQHFSLLSVALLFRHGERSNIEPLPTATSKQAEYMCKEEEREYINTRLKDLHINVLGTEQLVVEDTYLRPTTDKLRCGPGELTYRGYQQEVENGHVLRGAYSSLMKDIETNVSSIYVRSTKFPRTIQSTLGVLEGLFGSQGLKSPALTKVVPKKLMVEVDPRLDDDMHGVGFKPSLPPGGERKTKCDAVSAMAKNQHDSFTISANVMSRVTALFGEEALAAGMDVTDFSDPVIAEQCYKNTLPCGAGGCMQEEDITLVKRESDRYYCNRFAGVQGGANGTKIAMQPFLSQVFDRLSAFINCETENSVSVFVGHDTVVAPVLGALGLLQGSMCAWPPYASRVVFELWGNYSTFSSAGSMGEGAGTRKLHCSPENQRLQLGEILKRTYIRVLYNGIDLTPNIPECRQGLSQRELCPFSDILKRLVTAEKVASVCANTVQTSEDKGKA